MKSPSSSKQSKHTFLCKGAGSSRAETAVFVGLGLSGLVAIVLAVVSGSIPARPGEDSLADLKGIPLIKYVRSGQLAADWRTATSVVHYLFEAETTKLSNAVPARSTQENLSITTNTIQVAPKA